MSLQSSQSDSEEVAPIITDVHPLCSKHIASYALYITQLAFRIAIARVRAGTGCARCHHHNSMCRSQNLHLRSVSYVFFAARKLECVLRVRHLTNEISSRVLARAVILRMWVERIARLRDFVLLVVRLCVFCYRSNSRACVPGRVLLFASSESVWADRVVGRKDEGDDAWEMFAATD